ncbi:hypothetical protein FDP41_000658 [Naegleria fowleri]|uniref:RGS domain-containing protein n=1 Tax=Naegleria fowleri TaxID=5763 RepID=A0A6A5CHI8_NAEFO|nr:uncharacterized protein FDP41_000658 [Naegleria fowleri]KAF0984759.1 hypothetical protein FDP41_000658 [Naegleria fowleri]
MSDAVEPNPGFLLLDLLRGKENHDGIKMKRTTTFSSKTPFRFMIVLLMLLVGMILSTRRIQAQDLRYCSIANTTVIPLTTSLTGQQQPGILCPFGFIKQRNITSGLFTCQSVMDLLNDIVDKKDCFLPPGRDNEKSLPYFDTTNCIFNYLHCSPRTRKCTLFNTRSLGDACVDRFSCAGSVQKNHINCFEGKCTTLVRNTVLPTGALCPSDLSTFSSFISYENNTLSTCNDNSLCVSNGGSSKCMRVQPGRAPRFGSCGMFYTVENNTIMDISVRLCKDAHVCSNMEHGNCLPNYASTDFYDTFRSPFRTLITPPEEFELQLSSTYMDTRQAFTTRSNSFCKHNSGCSGNALGNSALQIKSSYSYMKGGPSFNASFFETFNKCDTSLKKCIRVFGKENGMPCSENAECRSTYCSPFNNMTCSELPKEVACGPSVSSASLSDCPGYSQCVCTNSSRGVCMSLCFAELTDLHSCSYNFGMVGSNSAISKMENTLIPFYDNQSSIFSLENGKCKEYMIKYFECMKNIQQEMNLETHDLPYSPLTRRNGMTGKSLSLSEPNDIVLKSNLANLSLSEDETDVFAIAEVNLTNIENNQFSNISEVSLTRIDMFNESSSSMLMQVSSMYSNFNISEQVVVYILERMAGLIPKYKTKEINFRSTLKVCGCCTPTVTNYLQDSLHGGILLKGNDSNILSSGLIAFSDLSLSNTISGFEPIMGHNSFLNRNWYEKCDIILVPAEDIDVITLSVKNNMLILDRNSTDGNSLKELEEKSMNELFSVAISNIPSKVLTIPRSVRDAALKNQTLLDRVSSVFKDAVMDNYWHVYNVLNLTSSINSTDCSIFNSTFDIKAYHRVIFSYPVTFDTSVPFPLSSPSFVIENDQWFMQKLFFGIISDEILMNIFSKLASPKCYSSYNSYLGVFHYNDVSKYWDLILKDSMLFIVIASCLLFYILLITSFRKSLAMKRRLFAPFIGPFCMMIICLVYIEPILMSLFKHVGKNIIPFIPIPNLFISLLSASYIVVSIRFYYLRNLYQIRTGLDEKMKNNKMNNMRIYRIFVQPYVTLSLVIIITCIVFGIWFGIFYGILESIIIERFGRFEWTLQFDASLLALTTQFAFLSLFSILCLFVDAFFNLKKIRKHGFGYYFIFDDPFHMRIDILSQLFIFFISIFVVLDIFVWNTLIINRIGITLFFLCSLMIFGGNIMIVETAISIKNRRTNGCLNCFVDRLSVLETEWVENMKDVHFRELQMKYAKNEFSLENFLLYEHLEKLEKQKVLTVEDLHYLQTTYLSSLSPYSINLPAHCYTKFAEILTRNANIQFSELETIKNEVIANNLDTFNRLTLTKEYKKWKEIASFQSQMKI